MMGTNLFYLVMEADGDPLQAFDPNAGATPSGGDPSSSALPPVGDNPPMLGDDPSSAPIDSFDSGGMGDMGMGNDTQQQQNTGADDSGDNSKEDEKLSDKANTVLNQDLYQRMLNRNSEVEDIIESIQKLAQVIPFEIVNDYDESLNQLKTALNKGQTYVVEKFVDAQYGENLLYFKKLDTLYSLLLDKINRNLKKVETSKNKNKNSM